MDEDTRKARIAANESVYRDVNERIEDLGRAYAAVADDRNISILCECGDMDCAQQIDVDIPTYERVRSDATLFIVIPGHAIDDVEDVLEQHDGFDVVCKHKGRGKAVAEATDRRR